MTAGDAGDGGEGDEAESESGGESDSGDAGTGDGGGGTGQPLTSCQQCASVNCSEETMPCATDQTCQECAFGDSHAPACADNEAWQIALACACEVCPDACEDIC